MAEKLIGYARVSTARQHADRQADDLLAAGVRQDDLYTDQGASGARAIRPALGKALAACQAGDTLVVTTLDRLGRSTMNMLTLAHELRKQGVHLRVLNLGGASVDTATPMGAMMFTVMSALAQMEIDIHQERVLDSLSKRRAAGLDLGGRRETFTDEQIRNAKYLIDSGKPATHVARELGISRATLYRRISNLD